MRSAILDGIFATGWRKPGKPRSRVTVVAQPLQPRAYISNPPIQDSASQWAAISFRVASARCAAGLVGVLPNVRAAM